MTQRLMDKRKAAGKLPSAVTVTLEIHALPGLTSFRPSKMLLDKSLPGTSRVLGTLHITPRPLHTCNVLPLFVVISWGVTKRAVRMKFEIEQH